MILGFDASTTTVGYSFYDPVKKEVIDAGFLDISKQTTNKEKAFFVISYLETNPNMKFVDKINLEASLSGFAFGKTRQQIVILLARFNAIFEYIISEYYKIPVNLISVTTSRKKVFGKCRVKGIKPKDYVRLKIDEGFNYVHKFDVMNTKNEWNAKNADMYDAVVISMAG